MWTKMADGTEKFVLPKLDGKTWFVHAGDWSKPQYWEGFDSKEDALKAAEDQVWGNETTRYVMHGNSWETAELRFTLKMVCSVECTEAPKKS